MDELKFTTSDPDITKLLKISGELFDIKGATELLHWDQETFMPPKGIIHRARQIGTLSEIYHSKLTAKNVGKLVNLLTGKLVNNSHKYSDADKALVRETKRAYDKATKIPPKLVAEMAQATSVGLEAWKTAKKEQNFKIFQKPLEKIVYLKREEAELVRYKGSPYDVLLDDHEPDLTAAQVTAIFIPLRGEIVSLLKKIDKKGVKAPRNFLKGQKYPLGKMKKISEKLLEKIGYDFEAGRQDISAHPFTINFGHADVRLTNRFYPHDLSQSIFVAIHEGGHALYELGISEKLANTLLAGGTSLGIHESQSRMWENLIGRSLEFWQFWLPYLAGEFPQQLRKATPTDVYREVNWVEPGFIRVDADEVTYNLHIILRFEIEKDLIEGKIKIEDLPEIWNAKSQELLGITPPNDSLGVLQDVHWSQGSIGYFPTYTLGNLYAAQFFTTLAKNIPEIRSHMTSGNFEPILHFLRHHIHQYGSIYRPENLIKKVTHEELNPQYFVKYLSEKYRALYNL